MKIINDKQEIARNILLYKYSNISLRYPIILYETLSSHSRKSYPMKGWKFKIENKWKKANNAGEECSASKSCA